MGELLELLGTNFKDICSSTYPVCGALWVLGCWMEDPIPHLSTCLLKVHLEYVCCHIASAVRTLLHVDKDSIIMAVTEYSLRTV